MQTKIEALLAVLEAETTCYEEMDGLLDDEEKSISLTNKADFGRIQQIKESLVVRLQGLEKERADLVDVLAAAVSTGDKPKTVSQLARCVKPPHDNHLLACAGRLRSIIAGVREKNHRNRQRISQHLGLIQGSLKLLSDLIDDSPVYHKPGFAQPALGFNASGGRILRGTV